MRKKKNYPQAVLDALSPSFAGEVELLRYEYTEKSGAVLELLDRLLAAAPACGPAEQWRGVLAGQRQEILAEINACLGPVHEMEEKVRQGRLSLENAKVCEDVAAAEQDILDRLTRLQRLNTASLQTVFSSGLPAQIKPLGPEAGGLLRDAINRQADNTQFMSNELQDLAIFLKESNKTITHPLDENHPE